MLGGTVSDTETLTLYDLAYSIVKYGARTLTLIIPYFGYSTMERATRPGEVVTAKSRARLLSSLPQAHSGNAIYLLDLHVAGLQHYFEGSLTPHHLYANSIVLKAARRMGGENFVLACTDAGRAKWVEALANDLGVDAAFVFKRRLDGEHTEVTAVSAAVSGRPVILYDDMIRTGGSLMGAARAYREAGASRIAAITTHGLFPGNALERLQESALFDEIVATDSHPRAHELAQASGKDGLLTVKSIAPLIHSTLTNTLLP